jgi:integrase
MPATKQSEIGGYWLDHYRGRAFWFITWYDAKSKQTKRVSTGTTNLREAEGKLAEYILLEATPVKAEPAKVALTEVFLRYWHKHAHKLPSAKAVKTSLGLWTEFWGEATVSDITVHKQEAFMVWLKAKGYKNGYIARVIGVGRAALRRAWKYEEITSVPYIFNEADRSDTERAPRLTMDDMRALITAATRGPKHVYIYLMLAINTLGRPGAILELSPSQADFDNGLLDLNPKGRKRTKKGRPIVPMTDTLRPILLPLSNQGRYVEYNGEELKLILRPFKALAEAAGLSSKVSPYSIRHTMAKELRSRGVPWEEIKGLLGHKIPGVTEVYAEFDPQYLSQGRAAIDAYISELNVALAWQGTEEVTPQSLTA